MQQRTGKPVSNNSVSLAKNIWHRIDRIVAAGKQQNYKITRSSLIRDALINYHNVLTAHERRLELSTTYLKDFVEVE